MKKPSLRTLKNKLDNAFSLYIRRRDTKKGFGNCISCGNLFLLQCGHFVKRQHLAVRWDERNAAGQCARCNNWLHGNEGEFAIALIRKYGQSVVEELLALKYKSVKMTRDDYLRLIKKFS